MAHVSALQASAAVFLQSGGSRHRQRMWRASSPNCNFKTEVSGCDERIQWRKPDANAFRLIKSRSPDASYMGEPAEGIVTARRLKPALRKQRGFMESDLISSPDSSIPHW